MFHGLLCVAFSVLLLALAGCEALQSGAPPVTPAMVRIAGGSGGSSESLAKGRRLLAQRCTNCHALEPVVKYTAVQWEANVQDMAVRSGLTEPETREITAYLVAARGSLP
ncbi:MAG: hypothetical protein WCQ57_15890 [Verrucomicrobiota bacterium]